MKTQFAQRAPKSNYKVCPGQTIMVGPFQEGKQYHTYEEGQVAALTEGQAAVFLEQGAIEPTKDPASRVEPQIWATLNQQPKSKIAKPTRR